MRDRGTTWLLVMASLRVFGPSPLRSQELTPREIVSRSARAMAPSGNINDLRTLRFEALTPGQERPMTWEIIRPNLVRKEREGAFILLSDGSRAGWLAGPRLADGTLQGPHLVPPGDWHHFEMDVAIYVPAFLDYPAEYAGATTVEGSPAHLLRVTLPMGGVVVYAVHAESFLPIRVELPAWDYQRLTGDFRQVGGFLLPHRLWPPSDPSRAEVLRNVAVNADLDRGRFVFPAGIR
jgi:hypothetical protein